MNGDLISRSMLLESMGNVVFKNVPVEHQPYVQAACDAFKAVAKNVSTVDAVEVVRCKDCTRALPLPEDRKPYFADGVMACALGRGDPNKGQSVVWPDDFCSDGVRRR